MSEYEVGRLKSTLGAVAGRWQQHVLICLGLAGLCWLLTQISPLGYHGWDDAQYFRSAIGWLEDPPYVGTDHWGLRHVLVLTLSGFIYLLGAGEAAVLATGLSFYILLVVSTYLFGMPLLGAGRALFIAVAVALVPLFAINGTTSYPIMPEALFGSASLWCFFYASLAGRGRGWLVASGAFLGLSWITRETIAPLIVMYGILFVVGYRLPRSRYLVLAAVAAVPVLLDTGFLWSMTGDPLYRIRTDLGHVQVPSDLMTGTVADTGTIPLFDGSVAMSWKPRGLFNVHWAIDPYLNLLADNKLGIIVPLAIIAGMGLWTLKVSDPIEREILRLLAILSVIWFIVIWYVLSLRPMPQYYALIGYSCGIFIGLFSFRLFEEKKQLILGCYLSLYLASSVLFLDMITSNNYPAKQLVNFVRSQGEAVQTDEEISSVARFFLRGSPLNSLVHEVDGRSADLYFLSEKYYLPSEVFGKDKVLGPRSDWRKIQRIEGRTRLIGHIVEAFGMRLPRRVEKRVVRPDRAIVIYRRISAARR